MKLPTLATALIALAVPLMISGCQSAVDASAMKQEQNINSFKHFEASIRCGWSSRFGKCLCHYGLQHRGMAFLSENGCKTPKK